MSDDHTQGPRGEIEKDRFVGEADLTRWSTPWGKALVRLAHRVSDALGPHAALIIILVIGAAIVVGATFAAAEVYDAVTDADGVSGLDHPLLNAAVGLRSPFLDGFATYYTDIAGVILMPIIAIVTMTVLALRRRSWTPVILITSAALGSLLMTIAGKDLIGRARPPLSDAVPPYEHSPSFPSGHTLNATVIAGVVAYLLILRQHSKATRALTITVAALFAFTVGCSRVFLGHHWFTDVLAAWMLGLAWLAIVITAHRLYLTTRKTQIRGATIYRRSA
jgi:membrane-associated phospholipid phosphatase